MARKKPLPFTPGPSIKRACYFNAFEHLRRNPKDAWMLVHGVVEPNFIEIPGNPIGHAWCEVMFRGGEMWTYDPSLKLWQTAKSYRHEMRDLYAKSYTRAEAEALFAETRTAGPWDATVAGAHHARKEGKEIVFGPYESPVDTAVRLALAIAPLPEGSPT